MFNSIIKWAFWILVAVFAFWPAVILLGIAISIVIAILVVVAVAGILLIPVALVIRLLQ